MNLLITFSDKVITMDEINSLDDMAKHTEGSLRYDKGNVVTYHSLPLSLVPSGGLVDLSKMKVKIADFEYGMLPFHPCAYFC
jgi:hypothetical protein